MKQTSKTGLTPIIPIKNSKIIQSNKKIKNIHLKATTKPAPFILKPYSGLYNPYPQGCSLLCNHPLDKTTKELFKEAKKNHLNHEKVHLITEKIESFKADVAATAAAADYLMTKSELMEMMVPEELFRKYTETDSRPLTPTATMISATTTHRTIGSRRCVTPEARATQPRAKLILDLRRTHSQETLLSYNSSAILYPKSIELDNPVKKLIKTAEEIRKLSTNKIPAILLVVETNNKNKSEKAEEEEFVKRRGKRRKKKERDSSSKGPSFENNLDPETQVGSRGSANNNHYKTGVSSSINNNNNIQNYEEDNDVIIKRTNKPTIDLNDAVVDSFLDIGILKQLRREITEEIDIDTELNPKRRQALLESLKLPAKEKSHQVLIDLKNALKISDLNSELWINLPRMFSRSSARFELPISNSLLISMTPLEYLKYHVNITSERKLLFNCIFNKFRINSDSIERKLSGESMHEALNLLMGSPSSVAKNESINWFRNLVGWSVNEFYNFKIFCGISALSERILAPYYCPRLPNRKKDPCHEVEIADFEMLDRKIDQIPIDQRLLEILKLIKQS